MTEFSKFSRYILPIICWMAVIFYLSSQPAKDQDIAPILESWISEHQLESILPRWTIHFRDEVIASQDEPYRFVNFIVRKTAHLFSFGLLAILFARAFYFWRARLHHSLWLAWGASSVYGAIDELHQWTVPGRTGAFEDVVIDSAGAAIGCLIYHICNSTWARHKNHDPSC